MFLVSVIYQQRVVYADANVVLILTCLPEDLNKSNGKGSMKTNSLINALNKLKHFSLRMDSNDFLGHDRGDG